MQTIAITGATGFVGSNVAQVFHDAGYDVLALTRAEPSVVMPWRHAVVDTANSGAVAKAIEGCSALVHTAIANDFQNLDAQAAYAAYPGLTQSVTKAAVSVGAKPIYISTDWVMNGEGHLETEDSIGRPINTYGFLKALDEQVIRDLAPDTGAICRIGGVMGRHRLVANMPRSQDVGLGYFVSSVVDTIRAGKTFTVWGGPGINTTGAPSLAAEIGATIERIVAGDATGMFHVVSDDAIGRWDLATLTCEVFGLDKAMLREGEPPESERFSEPVPVDTSLDNSRVKSVLNIGPVTVRSMLEALLAEDDGSLHPITTPLGPRR
jgi:dTDP-4-dehydrorhamnose reductase